MSKKISEWGIGKFKIYCAPFSDRSGSMLYMLDQILAKFDPLCKASDITGGGDEKWVVASPGKLSAEERL